MAFSAESDLLRKVQFLNYAIDELEGWFTAPAVATEEGTIVKVSATTDKLFETCGANDGTHILEQACDADGPWGSAANREKYLNGIPMNSVKCGQKIAAYPIRSGGLIRTSQIAGASETGAITAATITPGATQVEAYNGKWRVLQAGNAAIGVIERGMLTVGSLSMVEIRFY